MKHIRQSELSFAAQLARRAGRVIREHFDAELAIETKPDMSPLTQVDKEINQLVIDMVRSAYPDHGVLGEEGHFGTGDEEFRWLCDPLDGTKSFILGVPHSMFIIALLQGSHPQLSVMYDPFSDRLYQAVKGKGAFRNDSPIRVNRQAITEGYLLLDPSAYGCLEALASRGGRFEPVSGTGYQCMLIARGKAIGFINNTPDFHDVGPISLILEEAGGKITDRFGQPLKVDAPLTSVVASNGIAHQELLEIAQTSIANTQ